LSMQGEIYNNKKCSTVVVFQKNCQKYLEK
jgi:hypothetical protein